MNDIQKDYLIGLVIRKIKTFNLDTLSEVNINNDAYLDNMELFVNEYAVNREVTTKILDFIHGDEAYFKMDNIDIGKVGQYLTIKFGDHYFTIGNVDFINFLMTIECYMREYFALGSVVKLDKEKLNDNNPKDLIVVVEQRMVHLKGKKYYVEYRGIPYPMGIFNEQMYVYFSTEDILDVIHQGYNNPENEGYELALKESLIDNNIFSSIYQKNSNANASAKEDSMDVIVEQEAIIEE